MLVFLHHALSVYMLFACPCSGFLPRRRKVVMSRILSAISKAVVGGGLFLGCLWVCLFSSTWYLRHAFRKFVLELTQTFSWASRMNWSDFFAQRLRSLWPNINASLYTLYPRNAKEFLQPLIREWTFYILFARSLKPPHTLIMAEFETIVYWLAFYTVNFTVTFYAFSGIIQLYN